MLIFLLSGLVLVHGHKAVKYILQGLNLKSYSEFRIDSSILLLTATELHRSSGIISNDNSKKCSGDLGVIFLWPLSILLLVYFESY